MSGILEERYGVSISGVSWDAGPFKLWQGMNPNVILYSVKQPALARSLTTGRFEAAATEYRAQRDDTYKIVGGAAAFTLTTAIQLQDGDLAALKDQWRQTIAGTPDAPAEPVFVPLNTRHGTTEMAIPTIAGTPSALTAKANDAGSMGGTLTYMADLTDIGAQEWSGAIREGRSPIAQVMLTYEYLRFMPVCSVEILLHGDRVFQHFSGHLNASYDGLFYGGSVDLKAHFESLRTSGAIEMKFHGLDELPGVNETIKQNVISTVVDQGLKAMLGQLFAPKPDIQDAAAGNSGGWFGGANLALKWHREEQAVDIRANLEFGGFTWLTERADADLSVFAVLDESYVNTVNTELQFPATVTVVGAPNVASTAISWSPSEGQSPQSPVFTEVGGTKTYTVTSKKPDEVGINYTAKINYTPPEWPIVTTKGSGTVDDGLDNIMIKPSSWVGSTTIYLYVIDADTKGISLKGALENSEDYLVVNVSYTAPHLPAPIKASNRLTTQLPVTFNYPIDPEGRKGTARFSAFGTVNGELVHAPDQEIGLTESAVFVLVDDKGVKLVSSSSFLVESDKLSQDLLRRRDRVVISGDVKGAEGHKAEDEKKGSNGYGKHVTGLLVAVEYDAKGAAVWIDSGGKKVRYPLQYVALADGLRQRQKVELVLDKSGAASSVIVQLG